MKPLPEAAGGDEGEGKLEDGDGRRRGRGENDIEKLKGGGRGDQGEAAFVVRM